MKIGRWLSSRVALLPALAVFVWAWFAARVPEPSAVVLARGDATPKWDWADSTTFIAEPIHAFARWTQLAILSLPESAIRWTALANALAAVLLVVALAALLRRTFALTAAASAFGTGVLALLVASPAFAGDWLHGQRVGIVVVPLLLVGALRLLASDRAPGWRALLALALAAIAPFWHDHGAVVFLALVPALYEASGRGETPRRAGWLIALLLFGNLAAYGSMYHVGVLALDDRGLLGKLAADFHPNAIALLRATGAVWLDPLPATQFDETTLGLASWLAPLALWFVGDRSAAARRAAAPWWSCLWFGLLVIAWNVERHGFPADSLVARELAYGAFLLPIGLFGVLAAKFGGSLLPFGAGLLAILAVRDWHDGIEQLRVARMRAEHAELTLARAASLPTEVQPLAAAGRMPDYAGVIAGALREPAAAEPTLGTATGGDAHELHGRLRSSLTRDSVQVVLVQVRQEGGPFETSVEIAPDFAANGRDVPWTARFTTPLADGSRVRVLGLLARRGAAVKLGPTFVVAGGKLVAEAGG